MGMEGRGGGWVFFFLFPLPGRTSGPLHARLVFNSDKRSNFLKSIRSVIRKVRCEGFFFVTRELMHASQVRPLFPGYFCYFLLRKWDQLRVAQQGDSQHILGMMVSLCTRFEWCGLQQFSFHSSVEGNMRCCGLLPVTDLIYINVVRRCVLLRLVTGIV